MSFREVQIYLKYLDIKKHNEFAFEAQLHGRKANFKDLPKKHKGLSEKKKQALNRAIKEKLNGIGK